MQVICAANVVVLYRHSIIVLCDVSICMSVFECQYKCLYVSVSKCLYVFACKCFVCQFVACVCACVALCNQYNIT